MSWRSRLWLVLLVVTALVSSLVAAAAAQTLVLRSGQGGPVLNAGGEAYVFYAISPVGSEPPNDCIVEHLAKVLSNEKSKDKLAPEGTVGRTECATDFRMSGELTAFELSGKGALTLKAKPKLVLHIPVTLEFCEPGGKCKFTTIECAYGFSKASASFAIPGYVREIEASAVGKRNGKESDSRCAKTQALQIQFTARSSRIGNFLWAEL